MTRRLLASVGGIVLLVLAGLFVLDDTLGGSTCSASDTASAKVLSPVGAQ